MKYMVSVFGILACVGFAFSGCGFSKDDSKGSGGGQTTQGVGVAPSMASLEITPEDWVVQDVQRAKAHATIKTVKAEKLELIRKNFHAPRLFPITVPESNGFEIYEVRGYRELEARSYIHPKIYINSGNGQGQVLGYKTGKKDPAGKDLVEISIPVALVNGLVSNIPTIGGPQSGPGAAITLPEKYQIPDVTALKAKLGGKDLTTLSVCPRLFRMIFEGREYWAKSPFANLSVCPLNQFFRISIEAPVAEMKALLETAAVRDEAVTLITSLAANFDIPREVVELQFSAENFKMSLGEALKDVLPAGKDIANAPGYAVQDIEQAMLDVLFKLAHEASFEAKLSSAIIAAINPLIANYFGQPYACSAGGTCRSALRHHLQRTPVQISWMEMEALAASLETESVTALGAVANSSEFMAKPAHDQLAMVRRPQYFRARPISDVVKECGELLSANFVFMPETGADAIEYFKSYCRAMVGNGIRDSADPSQEDGYFPLGSNTVVYPGAWLKIEILAVSELSTAKTKLLPDGRMQIESEVVDLLGSDPNGKRTQCVEGNAVACLEYKKKQVPMRTTTGDQMVTNEPCKKGEQNCDCSRPARADGTPGEEVCTRKQFLFQDVLDFECKKEDTLEYCPYWRNQEDVVDYEVEHECQTVKVGGKSNIGCIPVIPWQKACEETNEYKCSEKSRKPIKAIRQRLNCVEDDPNGIARRERTCRAPQYKCQRWSVACTKYNVNEIFQIVHEEISARWRPFAIQKGEYPQRFEEDIYLKFVSPNRTVSNCRLNRFAREFRGNSLYIKLPSEQNEGIQPCDKPLWTEENTQALYLPKVYLRNNISYPERRLCGRTEYAFTTKEVPLSDGDGLVPPRLAHTTQVRIGPIRETCRAEAPFQVGTDLWFTEYPPIRFSGRVSVLGRVLESVVTQGRQL